MGLFRNKDNGDDNPWRYVMRERLLAIGDDSYIENAAGLRAFWVDGKAPAESGDADLQDLQGNRIYKIQERKARMRDTMKIEFANGATAAVVKRHWCRRSATGSASR